MWACGHCGTAYKKKGEAMVCEATCKALKRNIRREARHVRAGEHGRKQGLAIAYGKTRRAGYYVPRSGKVPRCSICNLFGHSTAEHGRR